MPVRCIVMLIVLTGFYQFPEQDDQEQPSHVLKGAAGQTVMFSADGKKLFTGGGYREGVKVWDAATWELVRVVGNGSFLTVAPDSKTVAIGYREGGDVELWDTTESMKICSVSVTGLAGMSHPYPHILAAAFSPDGQRLLAGRGEAGRRPLEPHHDERVLARRRG